MAAPRFKPQTNFTGGEITPLLRGRVDIAAYQNSLARALNAQVLQHGGIRRRAGTEHVSQVTPSMRTRALPFIYNREQAYVILITQGLYFVYVAGGEVAGGSVSPIAQGSVPYYEAQLFELDYAQSEDTMIITHAQVAPQVLRRFPDGAWQMTTAVFTPPPTRTNDDGQEQYVWSDNNWPRTVTFHDQRAIYGGSAAFPQEFVASALGIYFDFTRDPDSDVESFSYKIQSRQQSAIEYLVSDESLLVLTRSAEFALRGSNDAAISPTNIRSKRQSGHGCARVRPIEVDDDIIMVQREGQAVISLKFDGSALRYVAEDVSLLAEHLFKSRAVDISYARRPVPTVYVVLENGHMACCTLDRSQSVIGWWRWESSYGIIESVAVVPERDTDRVFLVVRRGPRRFLERVRHDYFPSPYVGGVESMLQTDNSVIYEFDPPVTAVAVPEWMSGYYVTAVADGEAIDPVYNPTNGIYALPKPAKRISVGLNYLMEAVPMPPEFPTQAGTGQGRPVRTIRAVLKVHESIGGTVNDVPIIDPDSGITGVNSAEHEVTLDGWDQDKSQMVIRQREPLPLHVLSVTTYGDNSP